jgi:quinol monooxygenase YgiN
VTDSTGGLLLPVGGLQEELKRAGEKKKKIGGIRMLIVHVHVHVKPEFIEAFRDESLANAGQSVLEAGIAAFEVLQDRDDPSRFLLVEVYRAPEDPARHKETAHYKKWRDAVEPMMAEARRSVKYIKLK